MKNLKKISFYLFLMLSTIFASLYVLLQPILAFGTFSPYKGNDNFTRKLLPINSSKKTVFIIADNKRTEIFDMLAPYYLFNSTQCANVFVVAKNKTPILIKKDFYVLPQLTFEEVDAMKIHPDVIVIPALSVIDEKQDTILINWLKKHFTTNTRMLAICDGASTAASTGFYDGKALTCHASDYSIIRSHFTKPNWVQQISVTKSGNLFSTAGVSNAVEGSLLVIDDVFGKEIMHQVSSSVSYPYSEIRYQHKSTAIDFKNKLTIAKKVILRNNRHLGLLLQDGINEFDLASVLDTYGRTFPASFDIFSRDGKIVKTKYGLTLIGKKDSKLNKLDELHIIMPDYFSAKDFAFFKNINLVEYDDLKKIYTIDVCLKRICNLYGSNFTDVVKLLLDYN